MDEGSVKRCGGSGLLNRARARRRWLIRFLCCGIGLGVPGFAHAVELVQTGAAEQGRGASAATAQVPAAAGMRAYVDPQTGAFTDPPPDTSAPEPSEEAFSRSSVRLVEVPGTTPSGGVMVDVRGRFMTSFVATVDAAGKPAVHCRSTNAAGEQ